MKFVSRSWRRRRKSSDSGLGLLTLMVMFVIFRMVVSLIQSPLSLVVAIALIGGAILYGHVMALRQAEARQRWHDLENVRSLSGVAFEHHVAELYEKLGYRTRVTRSSGDQGADVIAEDGRERLAIQCKQWLETVGNDAVQEVIAGKAFYGCDRAAVVCTTSFTAAAHELAERAKVTLITGEDYARLMARARRCVPCFAKYLWLTQCSRIKPRILPTGWKSTELRTQPWTDESPVIRLVPLTAFYFLARRYYYPVHNIH